MEEKEIFQKIMGKKMEPGKLYDQLRALKLPATYGNSIPFQMVKKAAEGDLSAAKYVLGAVQEPPEDLQTEPAVVDLREVSTEALRRMLKEE